ncbi:MAG: dihydrodipicolinate synthase family protein [Thermoguttaceae bacterium]|nr:dihydrodipicolinate synthase family protein [Thermoguttaceae bacterium]
MLKNDIKGLIAAPFTPMLADGSINPAQIPAYYRQLRDDGLSGVFVCGSAGEGVSMTREERMEVAMAWKNCIEPGFKLIVHIGHTSYRESQLLAEHAEKIGADAVGAIGPCFFKPANVKDLADFCGQIASHCPNTPFYYYHIPGLSGVTLSMKALLEEAKSIPNFCGMKFTFHNMYEYQQCQMVDPERFNVMFGHDENLLGGIVLGSKGAVGSLYNQMGKYANRLIQMVKEGNYDQAAEWQKHAVSVVDILMKYGGAVPVGKAMQTMIGIDCGPVRLPLRSLTQEQIESLRKDLESIGFFDWR